ncbi:MAG: serpin family protein, partial [Muribaculaceae bacterium]|nr:serpin family protein [Muribaculaceae bacterium]
SEYIIPTKISNSIWFNTGVRHNKTAAIKKYYNAEIHHGNLTSPSEVKSINSWISKSADGGINAPNFTVPSGTALIINSLLYFNQQWDWDYHFSSSRNDIFSTPKGPREANFMDAEIKARYYKNEIYESAILELTRYSIICLLPNNKELNTLTQRINADDILTILENSTKRDIELTFPVFSINCNLSLLPIFAKHGITPSKALASNIAITAQSIKLDQLSTIRVNQTGVAAGSVTSLCVILSAMDLDEPIKLNFNRPFIFFIVDHVTKTILFAGQYVGPVE